MKIKLACLFFLSATLLLFGCTKEKLIENGDPYSGTTDLSVTVPITRGLTPNDEGAINTLRMIVFTTSSLGHETGSMIVNKLVHASPEVTSVTLKEIVPIGYLNIYFIANEDASWNLGTVTTIASLKVKKAAFVSYPTSPFPMFSEYKRIQIDANGVTRRDGVVIPINSIDRIVSKVTLKLNCTYSDLSASITIDKASIISMPKTSTLDPSLFTSNQSSDYFNGQTTLSIGTNLETVGVNTGFKTTGDGIDFYIPEHLITQTSKYTYLYITGFLTTSPDLKVAYRLPIGNGINSKTPAEMKTGSLSDLTITRNMWYTFTATIKSFGEFEGLEVVPGIKPWSDIDVPGDNTAPYLNVSAVMATAYDAAMSRVYFWSNQPSVVVDDLTGDATPVGVNTIFDRLAGTGAANLYFDATNKTGYFDIVNASMSGVAQTKIFLKTGKLRREIIINRKISPQAVKKITTPYVGTFHRWNQTGERIVTWSYNGEWTAEVEDPIGSGADVIIDRDPSPAMAGGSLYNTTPTEAELCKVSGVAKSVKGMNTVYFRVGWKSNAPDPVKPKYAKINVYEGDGSNKALIIQTLYLRQGEEADYVMRLNDAGAGISSRPAAVKFSPYNLTTSGTWNTAVVLNGGTFTAYPTQAGAFWQWANETNTRYAYEPHTSSGSWNAVYPSTYWNTLGGTHETCPVGYYRPSDGPVTGDNTAGAVAVSEMRQSLWLNPPASSANNVDNSIFGYYADGFFDRLEIGIGPNTGAASSSVSMGTKDVAYTGRLFFNPTTRAALFLPAAGNRSSSIGSLSSTGSYGFYWSSSATNSFNGWNLYFSSGGAVQSAFTRSIGYSVRCVKEVFDPEYPRRHSGWAGSNIYWDGAKLTFDDVNVTTHEQYHGLHFKYGSLVAISPVGSTIETIHDPRGAAGVTTWANIPSLKTYTAPEAWKSNDDRAYAYVNHNPAVGTGDVCKYITDMGWAPGGKKWRLPVINEFGVDADVGTWTGTFVAPITPNKNGTDIITVGRRYSKAGVTGTPFFPATSNRNPSNGSLGFNNGNNGDRWSSSVSNSNNSWFLIFDEESWGKSNHRRDFGFPVRCVAE